MRPSVLHQVCAPFHNDKKKQNKAVHCLKPAACIRTDVWCFPIYFYGQSSKGILYAIARSKLTSRIKRSFKKKRKRTNHSAFQPFQKRSHAHTRASYSSTPENTLQKRSFSQLAAFPYINSLTIWQRLANRFTSLVLSTVPHSLSLSLTHTHARSGQFWQQFDSTKMPTNTGTRKRHNGIR